MRLRYQISVKARISRFAKTRFSCWKLEENLHIWHISFGHPPVATPSDLKFSIKRFPWSSSPTFPTIAVRAPSLAAATHWFAPFPPNPVENLQGNKEMKVKMNKFFYWVAKYKIADEIFQQFDLQLQRSIFVPALVGKTKVNLRRKCFVLKAHNRP